MGNYYTIYPSTTVFTPASMEAPLAEMDRAISYMKDLQIGCDGIITWVPSTGVLSWTDSIHIFFNNAAGALIHNSIATGSLTLADGECAYCVLSVTNDGILTAAKAAMVTGSTNAYKGYNYLILGFRNTDDDGFYGALLPIIQVSQLALTATPGTAHSFSGKSVSLQAGEAVAFGDLARIASTGKLVLAKGDAVANSYGLFMCVDASISSDGWGNWLAPGGFVRDDSWAWTVGQPIFLSTTGTSGNTLTQTAPSAANNVIQVIGMATHANRMFFYPQIVQVEHA